MGKRIAVIYCGGCNPEIDRGGLIRSLSRETGLTILPAGQAGPSIDVLLAVNGCARGCLSQPVDPRFQKLIVVAGLAIDGWPVAARELERTLVGKVNAIVGLEENL